MNETTTDPNTPDSKTKVKLYYAPMACSLAAHIACREAGVDVDLVRVDFRTKKMETGGDFFEHNPMGQVPTLELSDGRVLTENVAVLLYLSEMRARPTGDGGAADTYEVVRWLSFVATELHKKTLAAIYNPASPDEVKVFARQGVDRALGVVAARLAERDFVVGDGFSVADAYLVWALTLMPHAGVLLDAYPALRRYHAIHMDRPTVKTALGLERAAYAKPLS